MAKKTQNTAVQGFDYESLIEQEGAYVEFDVPEESGYDKDAYIERKKQEKDAAYALANDTADKVCSDPKLFQAYLDVQARFLDKSANNGLLICAQRPSARLYYSSKDWKKRGRYPKQGETSFVVLERGGQYIRDDGGTGVNINAAHVFDFTQTQGAALKERAGRMIPETKKLFAAMIASKPAAIELRNPNEMDGLPSLYVSEGARIYLAKGLHPDVMIRSLAEEFAHANLDVGNGLYEREQCDLPAQCAAYLFCKRFQLNTEGFDFSRVPELYGPLEAREKCAEFDTIRKLAQAEEKGVMKSIAPEQSMPIRNNAR